MSPLVARAIATLAGSTSSMAWEELSLEIAAQTLRLTNGSVAAEASPSASARITRAARTIESGRSRELTLATLAREARLSPFHFLRQFERLIGVTPHQYLRRIRLRDAATRLLITNAKILDVALDAGFGDVSNFNRAFRVEFGTSPRTFRALERRHVGAA
jgi:AraC-like DNA-binding protein